VNEREAAVTLVQWVPAGITLDFAEDGYGHADDIPDLEQQLREHVWRQCRGEATILRCDMDHPMYLMDRGGRLIPCHKNTDHDAINHGESDEHKACKERVERVMIDRGLTVHVESSLTAKGTFNRGRRNDALIINGANRIGYEAQYSYIHEGTVTQRRQRAAIDGITTYFGIPNSNTAAKNIIGRTPYGTYNYLPAEAIRSGRSMRITSGTRDLERWRCTAQPWRCPHKDRRARKNCTWHSDYTKALMVQGDREFGSDDRELAIDQDDLLYGLATGLYVPVQLKRQGKKIWQIVPLPTIDDFLTDGGQLWNRPETTAAPREYRTPSGLLLANPNCPRPVDQAPPTAVANPLPARPLPLTPEESGDLHIYRTGRPFGHLAIGWEPAGKAAPTESPAYRRAVELMHRKWRPTAAAAVRADTTHHTTT
jgi:hypothetical protein